MHTIALFVVFICLIPRPILAERLAIRQTLAAMQPEFKAEIKEPVTGEFMVTLDRTCDKLPELPDIDLEEISSRTIFAQAPAHSAYSLTQALDKAGLRVAQVFPNTITLKLSTPISGEPTGTGDMAEALTAIPELVKQLRVKELQNTANGQPVTVLLIDTGMTPSLLTACNSADPQFSYSSLGFGYNALTDSAPHGTMVSVIINAAPCNIRFISIKVFETKEITLYNGSAVKGTFYTTDSVVRGFQYAARLRVKSLGNASLSVGVEDGKLIRDALADSKDYILWNISAGNQQQQTLSSPARYAPELGNAIAVGALGMDNRPAYYTNCGAETSFYGTLSKSVWGTSFSTPFAVSLETLLWQQGLTLSPGMTKKLVLMGKSNAQSAPCITDGQMLNGEGSSDSLKRLRALRLDSLASDRIISGNFIPVRANQTAEWMSEFDKADKFGTSFSFELTDSQGQATMLPAVWSGKQLGFVAPGTGTYQVRLVVDGEIKTNHVSATVEPPPYYFQHEGGLPVTARRPVRLGETFLAYIPAGGDYARYNIHIFTGGDRWWDVTNIQELRSEYPGFAKISCRLRPETDAVLGETIAYLEILQKGKSSLVGPLPIYLFIPK